MTVKPAHASTGRITVAQIVDHMGMGGLQRVVASYLSNHDPDRFRVLLVRLQDKETWEEWRKEESIAASSLIRVRRTRDAKGIRALAEFLQNNGVQIVHSHGLFANHVARQSALLAGTLVTLPHYHNTYEGRFGSQNLAWERVLWPCTSRALMVSDAVRQAWQSQTLLGTERQAVTWVPVDFSRIDRLKNEECEAVARALETFQPGWPLMVSASRLFPQKRIVDILHAVSMLKRQGCDVRLCVAGDGPEKKNLERCVAQFEISDRVLFLGTISNIPFLLARADGSILASVEEGFSILNVEAMRCGTPVISTNVGVVPAIDPQGQFIHVIPDQSPHAIAQAIVGVLDQRGEQRARTEAAKSAILRFEATQWARNLEKIYEDEVERGWLANHRPWGYGSTIAPARLAVDRIRWRWKRRFG